MRHPLSLRLHLRRLLAVLLIALAASCAPAVPPRPAVAEETSKAQDADPSVDSAAVKTVRVGWLVDNQGFQSGTPGGYLSGWGYEYLQTLSYYTPGWRYEYVTGTFSELMDKLERGEIDLMSNISYTPERAQKMLFSANPQGTEHYYIYAKPSRSDLAKGDPQALNGLTIGCNKGLMQTQAGQEWLKGKGITCTYKYYDTANEIFSALASDDVDAIIMNDTVTSSDAMAMFDVGSSDYYFVTPLGRQDLMDDINAAMTALRSTNPRYNDEVKTRYSAGDSGSSSLTATERDWLRAHHDTIKVGYLDKHLPYTNEDGNHKLEGSFAALVDALRKHFGVTVHVKAFETNRQLLDALRDGTVDVVMPVAKDYWVAEQDGCIQSNTMTGAMLTAVYSGGDLGDALKTIACSAGSVFNRKLLEARYPNAKIVGCSGVDANIRAVKDGKATCAIVPTSALDTLRERTGLDGLQTAELAQSVDLVCWMRRGDSELLSIVNKGIVNADDRIASGSRGSGSYSAEESDFVKFVYRHRTALISSTVLALIAVIAVLVWSLRRARTAQRKAQSANAAKTAFLARMSHDIRTPLNGIIGLLEIDDLHPKDTELMAKNRAKAHVAADHLLTLMNDILEMGKLEDRDIVLEDKPFDLVDLCRDAYILAEIRASERDVTIETDDAENLTVRHVYGSPSHLHQVLLNLVDNSIKYNRPGGTVTCTSQMLDQDGHTVTYRFVIADTGIGMSPEFVKHIFEPFAQEKDDARSRYQGTGMGMPIVKALVEKMGGAIEVESEPDVGTTFTVTMPFRIDRDPEDHRREKQESAKHASIEGMRVMLAEDNELNAEIARELLESQGAVVTCVKNGREVLDLFCNREPGSFDAILMDIMMPGINGYEAARKIRLSDRRDAATIPIIAMTANAFAEDVQDAKRAGMNDHLSKPIELDSLVETLAKYRG